MRDFLRSYRALLGANWAIALEYRAQAVIWLLSFIFPLVMMVVWLAVVDEVGPAAGWDKSDFISYYVAGLLVNYLTLSWIVWDWDEDIRTGNFSFKLLKPLDPFHHYLSNSLGWKLFILAVMGPPLAILVWLSPQVTLPGLPSHGLAAVLAIITGFAVNLLMNAAVAMVAFWSTQAGNLGGLLAGIGQFLSGFIAPLPLFPAGIQQVARLLPFRGTFGLPIEIMLGRLSGPEIAFGVAVNLAWIAIFLGIYRTLWRLGLRRYEAVGA
ncbi:MAG: ABC transporter permease [Candidatus Promineifilaceae bacterium]